ncbi:MAG: PAS domain-containing protein [Spirochaetales bacterium]|nr:PAS domain-containing protein [Spirochaetales bacterium]
MDLSFERILDNIHNQIAVIDCNQNLIYSNNLFESLLLLYNTEILDLKQRSIEELFVKDLSPVKEAVQSCLRKGEFIKTRFNFLYFGRLSYFSITVIPEYGRSGTVARCILILQNDTEVELGKRELKSRVLFFSSLIKKLPIGVYQFDQNDSDLTISLWNPYMAGIFNKSESELMQQPLSSVFDDATMKRHTKMIQKIRETRLYYEYPAEYIRTPEGMRYFHTILTPIDENKEGPPDSFLGIMTDVTEKIENVLELKQYQRELKTALKSKSEELKDTSALFMSIMESTYGIDIFALNTEMKYLAFNAHHQIMMQSNYGLEIEIGKSFIPVLDILNDKKITALFDDALEGKSTVTEIKLTLPDGTISYMDAVFSPLKSLDVIIGLTVVGLETSQLRELEKEAATFKKIAESAEYGVLLTDRDYNIQFINQFMLKILQIEGAAPVGENLSSYIPHDQFEFIQLHAQMDSSQKKTGHIEIEIQPSEKAPASLLATVSPYESKDGESGGISFTCIDITPLKEASIALEAARNKAEKASIMKSSFVANMSHEIRTPLNAILGFAQLMKEQLDNPQMEIYLKNILSSGDILRSLINDILDFSKIEAGKMDINPEQVNMIEFFQEIYSLFELKAADKKLDLKILSIGAVPEYLETDPLRLRQILLNLVSHS